MLNCEKTSQLISQSLERSLTFRERFSLKLHLIICRYCKKFSQHLEVLRVNMKIIMSQIENDSTIKIPTSTKERIIELIETDRQQS